MVPMTLHGATLATDLYGLAICNFVSTLYIYTVWNESVCDGFNTCLDAGDLTVENPELARTMVAPTRSNNVSTSFISWVGECFRASTKGVMCQPAAEGAPCNEICLPAQSDKFAHV